jgi:PhnB protein
MPDNTLKNAQFMIPMLVCRDARAEVDFCKTTFGAIELSRRSGEDGNVVHSTLAIGGAMVMVHSEMQALLSRSPEPDGSSSVVIYAYVQDDVDAVVERAVLAGARVLIPVNDLPWGDRMCRIIDSAGHVWNVANRPAEISPKEPYAD